jgi:hypothetical protein
VPGISFEEKNQRTRSVSGALGLEGKSDPRGVMATIEEERVDTAAEAAGEEGAEVEEPPLKKSKPAAEAGPGSKKIATARNELNKVRAALEKKLTPYSTVRDLFFKGLPAGTF